MDGGDSSSGGFKGFSFSFSALSSPAEAEPALQVPQASAGANEPSTSAFSFGGTPEPSQERFIFSTTSLQGGENHALSETLNERISSLQVPQSVHSFAEEKEERQMSDSNKSPRYDSVTVETAHTKKAARFLGGDPCPPWTGALAVNARYPIPVVGEAFIATAADEEKKDRQKLESVTRWPLVKETAERLPFVISEEPAMLYLGCKVEAALDRLREMTRLERMKALAFECSLSENFSTMVHVAAYRGDVATLETLVELTGPAVLCVQDGYGSSVLASAVWSPVANSSECLKYLCDHVPDDVITEVDFAGRSVLSQAVRGDVLAAVQAVVERHPPTDWKYLSTNIRHRTRGRCLDLHVSRSFQSADTLLYLYDILPEEVLFWRDSDGETLVHSLCLNVPLFQALYSRAGRKVLEETSFAGKTVLHTAAELGRVGLVRFLVSEMTVEDLCKKCKARGALALHYAVRSRAPYAVKLLAAAMPPQMRFEPDFSGYSAMQLAEEIDAQFAGLNMVEELCATTITKGAL